jgi:hypothetical protein
MPQLSEAACVANSRVSPLDGVNMNRAFPGNARGPISYRIANFVKTRIFPLGRVSRTVVSVTAPGVRVSLFPRRVVRRYLVTGKFRFDDCGSSGVNWRGRAACGRRCSPHSACARQSGRPRIVSDRNLHPPARSFREHHGM